MLNLYDLEQTIEKNMQEAHVPGLALAIVHAHKLIYAHGFGVTSVEDGGLPVTPQTLFRIGSITKSLTGTAIMRLVEAGKLDLDTPIKTYIDWLRLSDAEATEHVTLRMLLTHTSGLPTDGVHFGKRDPQALEQFVREQLPEYTFIASHNTVMSYSSPGIMLAGYVAEVVSGKYYPDLMQELVFDPLQMQHTTFDTTIAMTYPLAQSHDLDKDNVLHVQHRYADNISHNAAGFAISTVTDLANFAIMHMQQGTFQGKSILTPDSIREMHKTQVSLYTLDEDAYGLTFFLKTYKDMQHVSHHGGISTFGSSLALLPETGTAVIMTFNRWLPTVDTVTEQIFDTLLDLPEQPQKPQTITPDRSLWANYCGNYLGPWTGQATIEVVDDTLTLTQNGSVIPLQALHDDLYIGQAENATTYTSVGFPALATPIPYIYVNCFVHTRTEFTTAPDPARWQSYEGTYMLEEKDIYTFRIVEGMLQLASKSDNREVALAPLDATRFSSLWGIFEFVSDNDGNVVAVKQGHNRICTKVSLY
jgi:CubicO group peptidase (beta-lactamase class C family)